MPSLPSTLYSVEQVVRLEQTAIQHLGIGGYTLMRRAGRACFDLLQRLYPDSRRLLILCGAGNNAGDGYVVARLADAHGYRVDVLSLVPGERLEGEARQAFLDWRTQGGAGESSGTLSERLDETDVVVDALLGTGLARPVTGRWAEVIETVNHAAKPVLAVDVPSGVLADTGAVAGVAIEAAHTISFIGLKKGLFTAAARHYGGRMHYHALDLPASLFDKVQSDVHLSTGLPDPLLPPRRADSHKGCFGHCLIVGGNTAMSGAVMLAAKAALRSGAGKVTVLTRPEHVSGITVACPEAMVAAADETGRLPAELSARTTHIAVGPGLGHDDWAQRILQACLDAGKPLLIDADALGLLAGMDKPLTGAKDCVLTPHPGEAATLLGCSSREIEADRFQAVRKIRQIYREKTCATSLTVVLKGAGTLTDNGNRVAVCNRGNAAMATAGMGDVLTGIVVALMAQGLPPDEAARFGVEAHARAGDLAANGKRRGLLASDLMQYLPSCL